MINVLEIIKDESTVGHKWPSQAICRPVGHPLCPSAWKDPEAEGLAVAPLGRLCVKPQTPGEFPRCICLGVQRMLCLFSPLITAEGRQAKIRGGAVCIPVCAYSRHPKYTPPPSGCRFFFLSMNVVGNCGYQLYGVDQVSVIGSRVMCLQMTAI